MRNYFADKSWLLALALMLVIGVYAYMTPLGALEALGLNAADTYYNSLVQGFRAGQLNLKKDVPPGLARAIDPYDPAVNGPYLDSYRLRDLSYYKGKLYFYWGVTPALILFWPYVVLTGDYLFDRHAATIFCTLGFLVSVGLLRALWRRYFAEVSASVVVVCAVALGLATAVPVLLSGGTGVYEVPIGCGYMLAMLALAAIWCALHESERRGWWLAAASLTYGLAIGARPSLLFGAAILLVPVAQAWRERRKILALLMAATGPILLIGLGLMLYNFLRFDKPFEFGVHYQFALQRQVTLQLFSLRYIWFNFRVCFLEPARWSTRFPFVHEFTVTPQPAGYFGAQESYGVLTNIPLVWLALAVPLSWRSQTGRAGSILRWFLAAVVLLFVGCVLVIGTFVSASMRYAVDFLPALMLLAVVGILGLERVLADRPVWRQAARLGWGVLLGFSVAFNLLVSVEKYAHAECGLASVLASAGRGPEAIQIFEKALPITPDDADGHANFATTLLQAGKVREAIGHFEQAVRLKPDYAFAHYNLGIALMQAGRVQEAIGHFEQVLRLRPDFAEAHTNLGIELAQLGRMQEAIGHFEQAVRLKPDSADVHYNLGLALAQLGKSQDAIGHYEQALRIKPDYAEAHCALGIALEQAGRIQEAIGHFEQALRIKPDYAEAHYDLGLVLAQTGKVQEAIGHFEQALRIKPDYAEAHNNLGLAVVQQGKVQEAIGHWEQALRIKPEFAEAHFNLGIALAKMGKVEDAMGHFEQALRIKPDFAEVHYALATALEQTGRVREAIAHYKQALRIRPDFTDAQNALKRLQAGQ